MINRQFMTSLAKLESVAATSAEKETINAIRGRYVAKFGTEHPYVEALNKLESVAATNAEKAEINKIRGKFGLFEMTGDLNKQNPELLDYADDELYNEGDTGSSFNDPADKPMSEEEMLSNKYGTPMSIVGEEIVRDLDPKVRAAEDAEDAAELANENTDEPQNNWVSTNIKPVLSLLKSNQFNDSMFKSFSNIFTKSLLTRIDRKEIDNKDICTIYDELGQSDFQDCIDAALYSNVIPAKAIAKIPVTVNGKQFIQHKTYDVEIPVIFSPSTIYGNWCAYTLDIINVLLSYPNKCVTIKMPDKLQSVRLLSVADMSSEEMVDVLLKSNDFIDAVDKLTKQLNGDDIDDGVYGTMSPDYKTPEDAYSDFDETHQYDLDESDPYEKYGKANSMSRITEPMAKKRGIPHRFAPKGQITRYTP